MQITLWLIGKDRYSASGSREPADPNKSAMRDQNFCSGSTYKCNRDRVIISEESASDEPASLAGRELVAENFNTPFYGVKQTYPQQTSISKRIDSLIAACSNTSQSFYAGFQYPLALKIVTKVECEDQGAQVTTVDYLIKNAAELGDFLVDVLRKIVKKHDGLELLTDRTICARLISQENPSYEYWCNLGKQYLQKAEQLANRSYAEHAVENFHHALNFFTKALQKFELHVVAPKVANPAEQWAFLQRFYAFQYQTIGTRDPNARTHAAILRDIGVCRAKSGEGSSMRHGLQEFMRSYTLLYEAYGSYDADTRQAYAILQDAKKAETDYLKSLPCAPALGM